jgi:putative hydrolase of HD superfamily
MYRMSILAMLIQDPELNRDRCIKMALVHDLAEAVVVSKLVLNFMRFTQ